jgi:N5-(cytidine 5'-diphosphoramidyl)-L-glutamine hydrolase
VLGLQQPKSLPDRVKIVAVTQRVAVIRDYGERRDCLDQAWARFIAACGLLPLPLPNVIDVAVAMFGRSDVAGLVLTGGNDLAAVGGDAPERDATENALLDAAESRRLPVIGVCRGMQVIQHRYAVPLRRIQGHVMPRQIIDVEGKETEVNSYHNFGASESRHPLTAWAHARDGIVKAIRHSQQPMTGIMWHPERNTPFAERDIALFRQVFQVT